MKLYVDDIRTAPEGWTQSRTVTSAIRAIAMFADSITDISLDHDISMPVSVGGTVRPYPSEETFQAVAYYIATMYNRPEMTKPRIIIHTANPVGALELHAILVGFDCEVKPETRVNRLEGEV